MFNFNGNLSLYGLGVWLVGTIALRFFGQRLLHPGQSLAILVLYAISFVLMTVLARRLFRRFRLPVEQWPAGAISLALPTLLLDPFSSAFFAYAFPNTPPEAAGEFGGWILCCCGGALGGAILRR